MRLTGRDVWEVGLKMGWASGRYDPSANPMSARADTMASLLNDVLSKRQGQMPDVLETEDAMRAWEAATPRETVLRLYKFLNLLGYTVINIDAAIERERRNNRPDDSPRATVAKKSRP